MEQRPIMSAVSSIGAYFEDELIGFIKIASDGIVPASCRLLRR